MAETLDLTLYLYRRLRQLGIEYVHGVPGDYNLSALDYLSKADLKWVGSCNELNGGYAADGYARVHGISAMVTTYGVGELSAINAHAGAFAERVPVVHIVGTASSKMRSVRDMIFHHSLGNYDYDAFARCFQVVSVGHLSLRDPKIAPEQIDNVLLECWLKKGPVYIDLPMDMVSVKVDSRRLATPLLLEYPRSQEQKEEEVVTKIINALSTAQRPSILIDMWALRLKATPNIDRLTKFTRLPTFVTPLGQSGADESSPYYSGIYCGPGSWPRTKELFEQADLILHIGPHVTDVSSFLKGTKIPPKSTISIHQDNVDLQGQVYSDVYMRSLLTALLDKLEVSKTIFEEWTNSNDVLPPEKLTNGFSGDSEIVHEWLWSNITSYLRPGDIVVAETGTASFGIVDATLPKDCILINPSIWASIGYGVAGAQGAALAAKQEGHGRRTVLFEGDGSFQLTCQELSTKIRHDLNVTIFLLNNDGYTIERAVHDTTESYNDIARWNYTDILAVFEGPNNKRTRSYQVRKISELQKLLADDEFADFPGVQLVEVFMPPMSVPRFLKQLSDKIKGVEVAGSNA